MQTKAKKRIGILRGGREQYAKSLARGGDVILHILENLADKYKVIDIFVDKNHIWHANGVPINPGALLHKADLVWNISHPSFNNILDELSIPNIGAPAFSEGISASREMLREHMAQIGVSMPRYMVIPVYQKDFDGSRERYSIKKAKEVFEKFGSPWTVRSFTPEANMGIHLAKTFNELVAAIEDGTNHEKSILVEEFISGIAASVHSVPGFRRQELYVFPPINGSIGKSTASDFPPSKKEKLSVLASNVHSHLGAGHYLKSDFIIANNGQIYLSNIEFVPDLRPDSHFGEACESVGAKMHHVVEHILEQVK